MGLQIRRRPARMSSRGDGLHSGGFKASLQFVGEEQIGQLALGIGPGSIVASFRIQVIKIDPSQMMSRAANRNYTGLRRFE